MQLINATVKDTRSRYKSGTYPLDRIYFSASDASTIVGNYHVT